MTAGILLLILAGFCWIGIAVVVTRAAREHLDIDFIQFGASTVIAGAAGLAMLFQAPLTGTFSQKLLIGGFVFAAGCGNFIMIRLMRRGMVLGSSGAVWGITQSALICPFVMGMLFFGVAPTVPRILGILLILLGILLFSRSQPRLSRRTSRGWLWPTLGAFLASGLAQCFANLPSYWTETQMGCELRAGLVQLGTIALFGVSLPFSRKRPRPAGTWKPILLLSLAQIFSLFFFFYRGLNILAELGNGSIGYPIAQGCCIAGFLLYSILFLKERCTVYSVGAAISICCGIAVIAC